VTDSSDQAAKSTGSGFPEGLLLEIKKFAEDSDQRYRFNSRCDTVVTLAGILLAIGIVAAGVYRQVELATILGALVTAIVTAQKAFPFHQRWQFYRTLSSQALNLATNARNGGLTTEQALAILSSLRLDFAQQIPRGAVDTDTKAESPEAGPKKAPVT
jgi:hypothetical protein